MQETQFRFLGQEDLLDKETTTHTVFLSFPNSSADKQSACQRGRRKRFKFHPWVGKTPEGGNGNSLQCSCLENSMNGGAWWAAIKGSQSQT